MHGSSTPSLPFQLHPTCKTDDDIWLDVPMLHRLMRVVHVKHSGSHTLVGNLLFTSWVEEFGNHPREYDTGFGFNCYSAFAAYNRRVRGTLNDNRTSPGPFVLPTGMLTVLSYSLAAELAGSASLTSSVERVSSSAEGRFGLEDKWLGSALQRFRRPSKLVLVALHGDMISDTYGVHVHTSTLLHHSRVKDVKRFSLVQNFSRMQGCSAAPGRADVLDDSSSMDSPKPQGPVVTCLPTQMPCVPRNSTFCTVEPTCTCSTTAPGTSIRAPCTCGLVRKTGARGSGARSTAWEGAMARTVSRESICGKQRARGREREAHRARERPVPRSAQRPTTFYQPAKRRLRPKRR